MQYTVRAFVEGKEPELDSICRTFCSMERTAYNLLREGADASAVKAILRERHDVRNARWIQSVMNQASAVMESQEEGIQYRIEMCSEKVRNMREKVKRLSDPLKVQGCLVKMERYESKTKELRQHLRERSYPRAVFGSRKLLRQLCIASGERRDELREEWSETRSNHFFSVGQANQRGNGNTRLVHDDGDGFSLEVRNWQEGDFTLPLCVPDYWKDTMRVVIAKAESVKLCKNGELLGGSSGLPYSVRVIRSAGGYQVLVSFELEQPFTKWSGRMAGIDVNPEGIACTITSNDGNLIATRFFGDNCLITALRNKRKWVLENLVNKMLRWARDTHGCNVVAVETLKLKGAYDYSPKTNFKLSNFMRRRMLEVIKLHALKMSMMSVEVNPAYTSMVAIAKYGKRFGGFNRHQLAAFVIARRALGYGEAPLLACLPRSRKENAMWNHCVRYYGYSPAIQTLLHHEPMERKSGGDGNGGGGITELLRARPANTSVRGLSHDAPVNNCAGAVNTIETANRRVGSVHPNPHTREGDGARGYRVSPPPSDGVADLRIGNDTEDTVIW